MKVLWHGFCAKNHSWSIVAQNICRSLIKLGHQVDMFSTNSLDYFPNDLEDNLIGFVDDNKVVKLKKQFESEYDMQMTYTAMHNFQNYLSRGSKNRFAIWTYEFSGKNSLPKGFAKNYKFSDHMFPPSQYAKQVFMDSGVPESHMTVVPHGINQHEIDAAEPYKLKTTKSFKILVNVAQVHKRKNLSGLLEMYGKAFRQNDDVCLVIKVHDKKPTQQFELDFGTIFKAFKQKYPNHAQIEIVKDFIPNIYSLYKACDAAFSASYTEAFGMTALEAQAVGLINIAPNYGGFLDFLNQENSLLIDGKEFFVKPDMVYWSYSQGAKAFNPSVDSGVEVLRKAFSEKDSLKQKAIALAPKTIEAYTWDKVTSKMLEFVR